MLIKPCRKIPKKRPFFWGFFWAHFWYDHEPLQRCICSESCDHNLPQNSHGNWDPFAGQRIGEAANPGPPETTQTSMKLKLGIVNPTSVREKTWEFDKLINDHHCDIIGLAETSATIATQKEVDRELRTWKYKALWSNPVQHQKLRLDGEVSKRGRAGGTAIFTHLTSRVSRIPATDVGHMTNRLVHAIIQFGNTSVQVFVIYGATSSIANSVQITENLIQEAIDRSQRLNLPSVFLGDFNMDVAQSEAFAPLFQHGYRHLEEIFLTRYGKVMDFTCNDATNDTAVIHPVLLPWLTDIEVNKDKLFDTHDPVFVTFALPCEPLSTLRYRIPHCWADLPIETSDLQEVYHEHSIPAQSIDAWCKKCELLVDQVIQRNHHKDPQINPLCHLPKRFKGRGIDRRPVKCPFQAQVKEGRNGDYNPPGEVCAIATKRKVTQLRRLQSLRRRIQKLDNFTSIWPQTWTGLNQEWKKICHDTCMGSAFFFWAQYQPEIGPLPRQLPSVDLIYTLEQIFRTVVDDAVYHDGQVRKNLARWGQVADKKLFHSKKAFAYAKGQAKPPLTRIATKVQAEGLVMSEPHHIPDTHRVQIEIGVGNPEDFHPNFPITINDDPWWISEITSYSLILHSGDPHQVPVCECHLQQTQEHVEVGKIFSELNSYWQTFWNRDPENDCLENHELEEFQNIFSHIPQHLKVLDVSDDNIDDWIEAIQSTKSTSAPGIDGVRAVELQRLPCEMIVELVNIMSKNPSLFSGNAVTGRTLPLPKTWDVDNAGRTRPITILPQLYRIWGKVVAMQAIRKLSGQAPAEITGFLKGRSAFQAAYDTQVWLEKMSHNQTDKSGVTLDLIKCYNLIRRIFASHTLREYGMPQNIITKWECCMSKLHRFWEINGQVSESITTTTGCAEGDPIAVVVMICIATTWVFLTPRNNPSLRVNAFADNWSWATVDPETHEPTMQATRNICHVAKLEIDPNKTWLWATSPAHEQAIRQALSNHGLNGDNIQQVSGAKDLGLHMQYVGGAKLGTLADRLEEGMARLRRIKYLTWDIQVKIHVIKASIYPTAFHGAEQIPIGVEHITKIRHLIAEAVLESRTKTITPVLSFVGLPQDFVDPGLHVILLAIKAARRWLSTQTDSEKVAFRIRVAQHKGIQGTSRGPAGTLKTYLLRLGWIICSQGHLQVAAGVWINLYNSPYREVAEWAQRAWNESLLVQHTQRSKMFSYPDPDKRTTAKIIQKYPSKHQKMLLREISQAFQPGDQKCHWAEDESQLCKWCQQPDSKNHRFLECPSTQAIRDNHPEAIRALQEYCPLWTQLPVIFKNALHDYIHAIHYNMPETPIPLEVVQQLTDHVGDAPLILYTDGSCQHPQSVETSFAAYAVIADLATSDEQRREQAIRYQTAGLEPETLVNIATGRLPRRQSIHRAETLAITLVCESFSRCQVFVDSQAAITAHTLAQRASNTSEIEFHPELDLVKRMFQVRHPEQNMVKIKAHCDLRNGHDLLQIYHGLGNKKANDVAIQTALTALPPVLKDLQEYHQDIAQDESHLKYVFDYILELQAVRARADAGYGTTVPEQLGTIVPRDPLKLLKEWRPEEVWRMPTRVQLQGLQKCMWGWQTAFATYKFFQSCAWPTNTVGPEDIAVGISWMEIAIGIMIQLNTYLPVKRKDVSGVDKLVFLRNLGEAQQHGVTLTELSQVGYSLVKQVCNLIPERLFPDVPTGRVKSSYMLGEGHQTMGLLLRPCFEHQERVVQHLSDFIQSRRQMLDLNLPGCDQWGVDKRLNHLSWNARYERSKVIINEVREVRKGL